MQSNIWIIKHFLLFFLFFIAELEAQETSPAKIKTLYNSLDPNSISQHLAFYHLYGEAKEGQKALNDAYMLLSGGTLSTASGVALPASLNASIPMITEVMNKHSSENGAKLSEQELAFINRLAARLPNRCLIGYKAESEECVLSLPSEQIDLARGVLLSQLGNDPESMQTIRSYEAAIDLMALQILTKVKFSDTPQKKIRAMNAFIFEEMGFRFPPHSSFAKDIDLYTFLPSVLDSRRGVCLGVSILYLCLAQRLGLNLEIVTPPGHIYVRWRQGEREINIETTARGVDLPSEVYLGVNTRSLQQRNIKETIGMAHFNQASVYWEKQQYEKALQAYKKAELYLPNDQLVLRLMSYIYLLLDKSEEAKSILCHVSEALSEEDVSKETIPEDYLNGRVSKEGIEAVFMRVDETRKSLIAKKEALQKILKEYPYFRDGYFSLASTWLQLHRADEALQTLERYHRIDPANASVEYYLAELYIDRLDYNQAWKHLRLAETLTKDRNHEPKALLELKQKLSACCPE